MFVIFVANCFPNVYFSFNNYDLSSYGFFAFYIAKRFLYFKCYSIPDENWELFTYMDFLWNSTYNFSYEIFDTTEFCFGIKFEINLPLTYWKEMLCLYFMLEYIPEFKFNIFIYFILWNFIIIAPDDSIIIKLLPMYYMKYQAFPLSFFIWIFMVCF